MSLSPTDSKTTLNDFNSTPDDSKSTLRDPNAPLRDSNVTLIDTAVVIAFKSPHSYTGEDVVEFQCHGGAVAPRRVLEACFAAGARLARRGEFTERAFLNGKLTYEQAEGVLDLVNAKTDRAADAALAGLAGARRAEMRRPIPLTTPPTVDELEAAAHDVDGKALSALYKSTRLIAASENWGGKREGAGNKPKAEQPSDVAGELCAEEGRDLIEELSGWALGADDGFGTLSDAELANAVQTLSQVLARAKAIQEARDVARKARA